MIKATSLERVMHFSGTVGRQDHNRRLWCLDGSQLGNRHLKVTERFKKEGFEWGIGPIKFINKQNGCPPCIRTHSFEKRAFDQELFAK